MTEGHYRVTQVYEPTTEEFYVALGEAGLEWPDTDILEHHRHPGLRIRGDTMALILHPVAFDESSDSVRVIQVAMVLGHEQGVVARWSGDGLDDAFAEPTATWRDLLVAVIEQVHDIDTEALSAIEERVDDCELEVLGASGTGTSAQSIYHLEHELLTLRRAVSPMVVVMDRLGRKGQDVDRLQLAEWRERFDRIVSQMEDVDNLLTSVLSVNLTLVSVRQNEDMRKIAAWGAIGIAPTAMAGIWGMNFRHMPELAWSIGYPVAIASIVAVCVTLYMFFRRSGWL